MKYVTRGSGKGAQFHLICRGKYSDFLLNDNMHGFISSLREGVSKTFITERLKRITNASSRTIIPLECKVFPEEVKVGLKYMLSNNLSDEEVVDIIDRSIIVSRPIFMIEMELHKTHGTFALYDSIFRDFNACNEIHRALRNDGFVVSEDDDERIYSHKMHLTIPRIMKLIAHCDELEKRDGTVHINHRMRPIIGNASFLSI